MYFTLREGDGDACVSEGFVNHFLGTVRIADTLCHQHILLHIDIHSAIAHLADDYIDAVLGIDYLTAVMIFGTHFLHTVYQHLAHMFDIGTIGHAYGDGGKFIRIVASEIIEVLAEELRVEE